MCVLKNKNISIKNLTYKIIMRKKLNSELCKIQLPSATAYVNYGLPFVPVRLIKFNNMISRFGDFKIWQLYNIISVMYYRPIIKDDDKTI